MKMVKGIGKQLVLTMGLVSLLIVSMSFIISYLLYMGAIHFQIVTLEDLEQQGWLPNIIDFIWILTVGITSVIFSTSVAVKLSNKFILPINSLVKTARQISKGNLSARAELSHETNMTELTQLVDDFNIMANKLEKSVDEINTWNAAIAHELRTPITILQGRLQGIIDGVFEPSDHIISGLLTQVEGLSNLVEDLRTLSLMQTQQIKLVLQTTTLKREILHCIDVFQPQFQQVGLIPVVKLTTVNCQCDPLRIQQALMALIENAIRYAKQGHLYISTSATTEYWLLKVEDEGPGIAPDQTAQLFDPFYRVEASRSKAHGGTGLGLAVVKAITEAHHGQVGYSHSRHGGSCFRIVLPLWQPMHLI